MRAVQRKRLSSIGTFGALFTLLVLAADSAGWLLPLERFAYDFRIRHCQWSGTPPTDRIVHIDIDDGTLAQVGRWPWPRSRLAAVVEELHRAGAKLIVMDVLFSEPEEPALCKQPDGEVVTIDPDAMLEDAIRRAGNVVIAASLNFRPPADEDPVERELVIELARDLELEAVELAERISERVQGDRDGLVKRVEARFVAARGEALHQRINRELDAAPDVSLGELRTRLTPRAAANAGPRTPLDGHLEEELQHVRAVRGMRRFAVRAGEDAAALVTTKGGLLPLRRFSDAALAGGFVDYLPERDGRVRRIPFAVWHEGLIVPQVGLVAACTAIGADVRDARFTSDAVTIPRPGGGELRIPTRVQRDGAYAGTGAFLDLPLFGRGGKDRSAWQTMYDYPKYETPQARVPMVDVVTAADTERAIVRNDLRARLLALRVLSVADPGMAEDLAAKPALDPAALERWAADAAGRHAEYLAEFENLPNRSEEENATLAALRNLKEDVKSLEDWRTERARHATQLAMERGRLAERLGGKVVFVGSTSTGASDFVATSIDARCPGVYLHGAAFNAIMTGDFWRAAPGWTTPALVLVMGALATLAIATFSPPQAFVAVLALAAAYAGINGVLLFDKYNLIVGAAGPLVAVGVVWAGVTLIQFVREIGERTRLTRRFSSYVDPTLVNYVVENPEQVRLEAHEKELTVCFSDLAGFTTLSEKLRAKSAKVLGQYMEAMVPLIRARRGYVNKFLGDGIMFFCGAPVDNPDHAADAVAIVLDMQRALGPFNEGLAKQGLPTLSMRTGVGTGMMVVGDAGPSFASDYTVLGDIVNLSARIESANKAFGTSNLITSRTAELVKDRFVIRPIADLLVVGKTESCCVLEAVAPAETATEDHRRLAGLTKAMFDAFVAGRFEECLTAVAELERFAGASKLTALYREQAESRRGKPPEPGWRGQIQLFTK